METRFLVLVLLLALLLCENDAAGKKGKESKGKKKTSEKKSSFASRASPSFAQFGSFRNTPEGKALSKSVLDRYYNKLDATTLFNEAASSCAQNEFERCFAMFSVFSERFPTLIEGFTNAGVALERMGRLEDAVALYRKVEDFFAGDNDKMSKARLSRAQVLQNVAQTAFQQAEYDKSLEVYQELLEIIPHELKPDAYINVANILERLERYRDAEDMYNTGLEFAPSDPPKTRANLLNSLCRLHLIDIQGPASGRLDITQQMRIDGFKKAKVHCSEAVQLTPNSVIALTHMGMLYKEGLEFDIAIDWMRRALAIEPNNTSIMTNLATTCSRNNMIEEAVSLVKRVIEFENQPAQYHSLGIFWAPFDRKSVEGVQAMINGTELYLSKLNLPKEHAEKGKCSAWTFRSDWHQALNVTLNVIQEPDGKYFGKEQANILEGTVNDTQLLFLEKEIVAIEMTDVYVQGATGIVYSMCEIYPNMGINTEIIREFTGVAKRTVYHEEPVINLIGAKLDNYYHWMAEGLTRVLLSHKHFVLDGAAPTARIILPQKSFVPHIWHAISALKLQFAPNPIEYTPVLNERLHFRKMYLLDWVQLNKEDPEQNDLWSMYLPPRAGLVYVRDTLATYQPSVVEAHPPIIYVHRKGVREVVGESLLIDALEELLGAKNFHVFGGAKRSGTIDGFDNQVNIFRGAKIIIGPHGAGLANMLLAPKDVSIVEFTMTPHCNRCFGYMAMSLDIDYWLLPQITCNYHMKYHLDDTGVSAAIRLLRVLLFKKDLSHLIANADL